MARESSRIVESDERPRAGEESLRETRRRQDRSERTSGSAVQNRNPARGTADSAKHDRGPTRQSGWVGRMWLIPIRGDTPHGPGNFRRGDLRKHPEALGRARGMDPFRGSGSEAEVYSACQYHARQLRCLTAKFLDFMNKPRRHNPHPLGFRGSTGRISQRK